MSSFSILSSNRTHRRYIPLVDPTNPIRMLSIIRRSFMTLKRCSSRAPTTHTLNLRRTI